MKSFLLLIVAITFLLSACNPCYPSTQPVNELSEFEDVQQSSQQSDVSLTASPQVAEKDISQPTVDTPDWAAFKLRVVNRDGKPVPNLRIYFAEQVQNTEKPHKTNDQYLGPTNEMGEYIYQQASAGNKVYFIANSEVDGEFATGKKYSVQMDESKRAEPITIVWEDNSPRETAMALENKAVLTFSDADGNPLHGVHLVIQAYSEPDLNGTSVDTGWSTKAYTEADGSFVLGNPEKGVYSILASYPDSAVVGADNTTFHEYSFEVTQSGTTDVQFVFLCKLLSSQP